MERVVTATEARMRFGELMRQVVELDQVVFVERDGVPRVVVLSVAEYERLRAGRQVDRREALDRLARLGDQILARRQGQPLPPPEEIIREMREERGADYDRWLGLH